MMYFLFYLIKDWEDSLSVLNLTEIRIAPSCEETTRISLPCDPMRCITPTFYAVLCVALHLEESPPVNHRWLTALLSNSIPYVALPRFAIPCDAMRCDTLRCGAMRLVKNPPVNP
jgi:hypothetical protein